MTSIPFTQITPYRNGKPGLIAGVCQAIGLDQVFNEKLTHITGRPPTISYGATAQMFLMSMADEHHPLSRLNEYLEDLDLESLLNMPIDRSALNDDRFGKFLDSMHEVGGASILSAVAVKAFTHYGIYLSSINYDTTSKVMWGEYETPEGTVGTIDITFGHSKQHRPDKKQLKISMGTTQGICIDGQVHSGNMSDKTYNLDNIDRAVSIRQQFRSDGGPFYYIADSAAFSSAFFTKAKDAKLEVITRMPDNVLECKAAVALAIECFDTLAIYELPSSTTPSVYRIMDHQCVYNDIPLKMGICYSQKLEGTKTKAIHKKVEKEEEVLLKALKSLSKRNFACHADALIELEKFNYEHLKKAKFHDCQLKVQESLINRPGRPSKDLLSNPTRTVFNLQGVLKQSEVAIHAAIKRECIFVVVSTDLTLTGFDILKEYKSQSAVERKFQFLKSPQFVNALYVDSPRRAESLGYLMLILMLVLSVAEYVVRREMAKESATLLGPGQKILTRPSLIAIFRIFYSVQTVAIRMQEVLHRGYSEPLRDNVAAVMGYLGLPSDLYIRGTTQN